MVGRNNSFWGASRTTFFERECVSVPSRWPAGKRPSDLTCATARRRGHFADPSNGLLHSAPARWWPASPPPPKLAPVPGTFEPHQERWPSQPHFGFVRASTLRPIRVDREDETRQERARERQTISSRNASARGGRWPESLLHCSLGCCTVHQARNNPIESQGTPD